MSRRMLVLLVLLAAAALPRAAAEEPASATIVVTLPADAKVYFDDALTQQTGETRRFMTPSLEVGKRYAYQLAVEVVRDGKTIKQTKKVQLHAGETVTVDFRDMAEVAEAPPAPADGDAGWPRVFTGDNATITIYQPQVEKWEGTRLEARAAVSLEPKGSGQPQIGIIWLTALTQINKEERQVALSECQITRAQFPTAPEKADGYLAMLRNTIPHHAHTIALDRLEANLAVVQPEVKARAVEVKNEPPEVLVSAKPALLVLIDGEPMWRLIDGSKVERAINTRSLILHDQAGGKYYLRVMNRWMEASALEGTWSNAANAPEVPDAALRAMRSDTQIDWLNQIAPDLKEAFDEGSAPAVFVRTKPTELVETKGEPELAPIEGTNLLWVKNSPNQLLRNAADEKYYLLLSGRWFRAPALTGSWEFVAADKLPADFADIPPTHPRGDVLASVAGTPQAEAAVIASRIPQTAVIKASEATLEPKFDGEPQFEPIEQTDLKYAVNSPTPIIELNATSYYALENGVWFTASSPKARWTAARSVPAAIYRMPVWSPLYYTTYAYVYYYDPLSDYLYLGYTPGYFGVYVSWPGVVVYGTGWWYRPWLNSYWWGRPWTYGWAARFGWTPAGWAFGFGVGGGWVWWGPLGWHDGWCHMSMHPDWKSGWGGQYANAHINQLNFANVNIYNRLSDHVHIATAMKPPTTGGKGLNNTFAGQDGNVYRQGEKGWEVHTAKGWQPADNKSPTSPATSHIKHVEKELAARKTGDDNVNRYRSSAPASGQPSTSGSMHSGSSKTAPQPVHQTPTVSTPRPTSPPPPAPRYIPPPPPRINYGGFHGGVGGFRGYGGYGGLVGTRRR